MKHQLGFLGAASPVLLEPALRTFAERPVGQALRLAPETADCRALLTFNATGALYLAGRALRSTGRDTVLVPGYNCGHEVEPLLRAGFRVKYFRVDERLSIDLEDLAASIDAATRAVLVTHYFGFPQDLAALRAICDERGVVLIEDCAHALFSRQESLPLGSVGEIAVFSLRKTLPLPQGGALLCRDRALELPSVLARPPRLSTCVKLLERYQKGWLLPKGTKPGNASRAAFIATRLLVDGARTARALAHACGQIQLDPDDESFDFPAEALEWGVSPGVERALLAVPAQDIVAARRRNYETLLAAAERFVGCAPIFSMLPPGVCPLYFPVRTEDAAALTRRLRRAAVSAVEWWSVPHEAVPWDEYPEAERLKHSVVALPVHQDLGDVHMERIAAALTQRSGS